MNKINVILIISFAIGLTGFAFGLIQIDFINNDNKIIYDEFCFNSGFDKSTSTIIHFNETLNYIYCTKKIVNISDKLIINISTVENKLIYPDKQIIPSNLLFSITLFSTILLIVSLVILICRNGEL